MTDIRVQAVKAIMNAWPSEPDESNLSLAEIFKTDKYLDASPETQKEIQLKSAQFRYDYERQSRFMEEYFPDFDTEQFRGKDMLDLGCFTAGRMISWKEEYGFDRTCGIDVHQTFIDAARAFAAEKDVEAEFYVGFGEDLPFDDDSFDFIFSYDVFEHVQNVAEVLKECQRVLKPNGQLLVVFPPFYNPLASHLYTVTKVPGLQIVFPREIIAQAYFDIVDDRGSRADWYRRETPELEEWERLIYLNGMTVNRFRNLIKEDPQWEMLSWSNEPIFRQGIPAKQLKFRLLSYLFVPGTRIPLLEEVCLGRICCVLQKS